MFTYDEAIAEVDNLMARAIGERHVAAKHGLETMLGDASLRFAGQFTAEAQVWATVALAATSRERERLAAGI